MKQIIISRDENFSSIDSNEPLLEYDLLTILLDSMLHVSSKIARTHNCQDKNCELQSFASKVNSVIINGLKKEIKFYGPSGPNNGREANSPTPPLSGSTRDINAQLDKWLNDIHEAESHSEGNTGPEERRI